MRVGIADPGYRWFPEDRLLTALWLGVWLGWHPQAGGRKGTGEFLCGLS